MATKWTEKDVMEHARELRSPFETLAVGTKQPNPQEVLQKLKDRGNGGRELPSPEVVKEG